MEQVDKLCTHLVILKRGSVVGAGTMGEMHQGFAGLDLEAGFMQLTEQEMPTSTRRVLRPLRRALKRAVYRALAAEGGRQKAV